MTALLIFIVLMLVPFVVRQLTWLVRGAVERRCDFPDESLPLFPGFFCVGRIIRRVLRFMSSAEGEGRCIPVSRLRGNAPAYGRCGVAYVLDGAIRYYLSSPALEHRGVSLFARPVGIPVVILSVRSGLYRIPLFRAGSVAFYRHRQLRMVSFSSVHGSFVQGDASQHAR